jgi:hypothetical protein
MAGAAIGMSGGTGKAEVKSLPQVLAVICIGVIWSVIVHKGYVDISGLAERHAGGQFWVELARYFLRNIAGGGTPESGS